MLTKPKTNRDPKYLKWLRGQPCVVCGTTQQIHAHHSKSGGIGIKGPDDQSISLCHPCHARLHNLHGKGGDWSEEERQEIVTKQRTQYLKETNK